MNEETGDEILALLDVLSSNVAEGHAELRHDIRGLGAKVTSGFERVEGRLGRLETRIDDVETEARLFRPEFGRRVAPLQRRRPK